MLLLTFLSNIMTTLEIAKTLLQDAHETLEGTMGDVTNEIANWQPKGKSLSVGAAYAHAVVSEDMLLNTMMRKAPLLIDQGWSEKMGLSSPHPVMGETWEQDFSAWVKTVTIDIAQLQEYGKAVQAQTNTYLSELSEDDFINNNVDLTSWGMGEYPLWRFFHRFIIGHADNITGEISAVKGMQNLKGYPF